MTFICISFIGIILIAGKKFMLNRNPQVIPLSNRIFAISNTTTAMSPSGIEMETYNQNNSSIINVQPLQQSQHPDESEHQPKNGRENQSETETNQIFPISTRSTAAMSPTGTEECQIEMEN